MDQKADPKGLLECKDRLPEGKQRYQHKPLKRRGKNGPGDGNQRQ
jgi:hypothetical protein